MSNVLPKYTPQSPKDETEMILTTPKDIQKTQTFPSSIQMNGCDTASSTSVQNSGVALDQTLFPATPIPYVRLAISGSVELVLSVTISPMMLLSALSFCLIFITVIHFLLGAPKIWSVNFRKFIICHSVITFCQTHLSFCQVWPHISDPLCSTLASCWIPYSIKIISSYC